MPVPTLRQLLEAGIHFGHQTRRWNPKMGRYIFGQRNGIYIIDLRKTLEQIEKAHDLARETAGSGAKVLFLGTKKQAQEIVAREAQRCGMYYVNSRWLGGTLTNFETVRGSIRRLLELEEQESRGYLNTLPKKQASHLRREKLKLEKNLLGIKDMERLPGLLFVVDVRKEAIAVREAKRMGIPCIGIVDTNADPDTVPVPIPGNDDAMRAIDLFCGVIADAVLEGIAEGEKVRELPEAERVAVAAGTAVIEEGPAEPIPVEEHAAVAETEEEEDEAGDWDE